MREVAGSIPARPLFDFTGLCETLFALTAGLDTIDSRVYSSAVEHGIADPAVAGSIPAAP